MISEPEELDVYEDEDTETEEQEEVIVSYACEECDYRWEATFEDDEQAESDNPYCPMCGSSNVTQI